MQSDNVIEQKTETAPEDAAERVTRVRKHVESYWKATTTLRTNTKESHDMVVGGLRQWKDGDAQTLAADSRPVLSFNICQDKINFLSGYQSEREQDYRYFPRGTEDEQLGRLLTSLVKHARDRMDDDWHQHKQFRQGIIGGQSTKEISHGYNYCDDFVEGEVYTEVLPENAWGCDVGARRYDRCDATYQFKMTMHPLEYARRTWPKVENFQQPFRALWNTYSAEPSTTGVPDHFYLDQDTQQLRLIQYWWKKPIKINIVANTQTGETEFFKSEKAAEAFITAQRDAGGQMAASAYQLQQQDTQNYIINVQTQAIQQVATPDEGEAFIDRVKQQAGAAIASQFRLLVRDATAMRCAHYSAWNELDDQPSPFGPEEWRYPFSNFTCYQDLDDFNSIKGLIEDIKDPQREVNWHYSSVLDQILRGPKGGTWVDASMESRIQKLKMELPRAGFIGVYTGQPPVQMTPSIVSQADIDMIQFCIGQAMMITGLNQELMGQSTQKTISGRAKQASQAGALVGVSSLLMNWMQTKKYQGQLYAKRVQQFYSEEKMNRVIGQSQRMAKQQGLMESAQLIPDATMFAHFKTLKNVEMDTTVGFQEASPTARMAQVQQLAMFMSMGIPVSPEMMLEVSDTPYKDEIKAALAQQGMGQPNEMMIKALSAMQGSGGGPTGVNK